MRASSRAFQRQLQDEIQRRGGSDLEYIAYMEEKSLFVRQLAQGNTAQVVKQIAFKKQLLAEPVDKEGNLPIHVAAINGRDDLIVKLIELGADPNARNYSEETPMLMILTKSFLMNSLVLYETLIKGGALVSLRDPAGRSVVSNYMQCDQELSKLKGEFTGKLRELMLVTYRREMWDRRKVMIYAYTHCLEAKFPAALFRDIALEYW